jgi:AmmeMemoRadiSam system protein A
MIPSSRIKSKSSYWKLFTDCSPEENPALTNSPKRVCLEAVPNSVQAQDGPVPEGFNEAERQVMLRLARQALVHATANVSLEVEAKNVPPRLRQKRACFVTLTNHGSLRGCIGNILPLKPLFQAILDNAGGAALRDPRFPPVEPHEVDDIQIEISVLTEPEPLVFASPEELLSQLQPQRDGVLLRIGAQHATFLPQVWEKVPDKIDFLNRLAQKAGHPPSRWREPDASISVYRVESFEETAKRSETNSKSK